MNFNVMSGSLTLSGENFNAKVEQVLASQHKKQIKRALIVSFINALLNQCGTVEHYGEIKSINLSGVKASVAEVIASVYSNSVINNVKWTCSPKHYYLNDYGDIELNPNAPVQLAIQMKL